MFAWLMLGARSILINDTRNKHPIKYRIISPGRKYAVCSCARHLIKLLRLFLTRSFLQQRNTRDSDHEEKRCPSLEYYVTRFHSIYRSVEERDN